MNKGLKYLPSIGEVTRGMLLMLLGLLMLNGGGFAIQSSLESEPYWMFPEVETWACWVIIWFGFDSMLFKDKATSFVLNKTLVPLLRRVFKGIRGEYVRFEESESKSESAVVGLLRRLM